MNVLAAALLPTLAVAAPFEGVLTGRMFGPHASGTSRAYVSPAGLRNELEVETPASRASGADKVRAISPYRSDEPDRVYVLDPVRRTSRVAPVRRSPGASRSRRLQRQDRGVVAGLACQKVVLTDGDGGRIDACISTEIGRGARWLRAVQEGDAGVTAGASRALAAAGLSGYPLRWVLRARGGSSALTVEVTAVERGPVPAPTFALPDGFALAPAR